MLISAGGAIDQSWLVWNKPGAVADNAILARESRADKLAKMVRDAMRAIERSPPIDCKRGVENGWPEGYFAETAGVFADEPLSGGPQGELPARETW